MEYFALSIVSLVVCMYAYILGAKHGMSISKGRVPQPLKEVVSDVVRVVEAKKDPAEDIMQQVASYDYEAAYEAVRKEHLGGKR